MSKKMFLRGTLEGHNGWVTSVATCNENPNILVSGSRDKSVIVWDIKQHEGAQFGIAKKSLRGHNHFVSDVVCSADGGCALSSSWDGTLRLWDLNDGRCLKRFIGHTKDVLSVTLSSDNRQIVSGSRDRSLKLWNTVAECKYTMTGHNDWVSCVRFSPATAQPVVVSCGWDRAVKVWNLSTGDNFCKIRNSFNAHTGYLNTITISPDGSLCASGGKDGVAMLWDLTEGKHLYTLEAGDIIHSLVFSPNRYWLVAATQSSIKIWDLESKELVDELKIQTDVEKDSHATVPYCVSLAWSADGSTLFAGYTDHKIRVYQISN